jgi:hypothetical protein
MKTKTKLTIGGIIGGIILVSLFFIPINDFGIDSNSSELPPRVMILSGQPDDFEITNPSCTKDSKIVQFQFNLTNKLDADHRLELHLIQNDMDGNNLAKQAILVETTAHETTFENHQMLLESEMNMCVIELKRFENIT